MDVHSLCHRLGPYDRVHRTRVREVHAGVHRVVALDVVEVLQDEGDPLAQLCLLREELVVLLPREAQVHSLPRHDPHLLEAFEDYLGGLRVSCEVELRGKAIVPVRRGRPAHDREGGNALGDAGVQHHGEGEVGEGAEGHYVEAAGALALAGEAGDGHRGVLAGDGGGDVGLGRGAAKTLGPVPFPEMEGPLVGDHWLGAAAENGDGGLAGVLQNACNVLEDVCNLFIWLI